MSTSNCTPYKFCQRIHFIFRYAKLHTLLYGFIREGPLRAAKAMRMFWTRRAHWATKIREAMRQSLYHQEPRRSTKPCGIIWLQWLSVQCFGESLVTHTKRYRPAKMVLENSAKLLFVWLTPLGVTCSMESEWKEQMLPPPWIILQIFQNHLCLTIPP